MTVLVLVLILIGLQILILVLEDRGPVLVPSLLCYNKRPLPKVKLNGRLIIFQW